MKVKVACTEQTTTYYVVEVESVADAERICKEVNEGKRDVEDFDFDSQSSSIEQTDFRFIEQLSDDYEVGSQ